MSDRHNRTSIYLDKATRERIRKHLRYGDTFVGFINSMLDVYESKRSNKEQNN